MKLLTPFIFKIVSMMLLLNALILCSCQQNKESLAKLDESTIVPPPQSMNVEIDNYVPQSGNSLQHIFVSNFSLKVSKNQLHWSTSRDGLPDTIKTSTYNTYGFSIDNPESVVDGFSDLLLYNSGIDLSQQNLMNCPSNQMASTSNDMIIYNDDRYSGSPQTSLGMRDCEKSYVGLNPNTFDYNNNGIPDYLEIRCGLNPLNPTQAFVSTAGDGVANIDKCKMNIPIDENVNTPANKLYAYQYVQTVNPDNSIKFHINNIPIVNDGNANFLVFYIVEANSTTNTKSLYTAYAILKEGYNGKTLKFAYWATDSSHFFNQIISVP